MTCPIPANCFQPHEGARDGDLAGDASGIIFLFPAFFPKGSPLVANFIDALSVCLMLVRQVSSGASAGLLDTQRIVVKSDAHYSFPVGILKNDAVAIDVFKRFARLLIAFSVVVVYA